MQNRSAPQQVLERYSAACKIALTSLSAFWSSLRSRLAARAVYFAQSARSHVNLTLRETGLNVEQTKEVKKGRWSLFLRSLPTKNFGKGN